MLCRSSQLQENGHHQNSGGGRGQVGGGHSGGKFNGIMFLQKSQNVDKDNPMLVLG